MADQRSHLYGPMPSTRWGLVAAAARAGDRQQREALEVLLKRYLPALKAHLVFRKGMTPERAEDVLQSFIVSKVLEHALIERADPARGRFRTFLLTSLERFVISQARADQAGKRTPEPQAIQELTEQLELRHQQHQPATVYEVEWAREVLQQATDRMYAACEGSSRMDIWGVFECRLLAPLLDGATAPAYAELIDRFGFTSPAQASNALITAKRMFARILRGVVSEYVQDPDQVEHEIQELRSILSHSRS